MEPRVVLIDPDERREILARRLRSQGFAVRVFADPAAGANAVLAAPPHAVVADLWMPGISGVPLTRLLNAEPATMDVPVVLRATTDEPRNRFWARHAGAAAYVSKGRMGELVRALRRVIVKRDDDFFMQLGAATDVRDRLSAHLDRALFESVLASEIRALASAGSFPRLLDLTSQLLVQITKYRWMAIRDGNRRIGLHCHPEARDSTLREVETALGAWSNIDVCAVEDDDAENQPARRVTLTAPIKFAGVAVGTLALSPSDSSDATQDLVDLVGQELGGAVRMVELIEETQRLATMDGLTGLLRRAPFCERLNERLLEPDAVALLLIDLDNFKRINDEFGHRGGDEVLRVTGAVMQEAATKAGGSASRWGGEEFVLEAVVADARSANELAERVCLALRRIKVVIDGRCVPVSGSVGVTVRASDDTADSLVDRADSAMYAAKAAGRDRVCYLPPGASSPGECELRVLPSTAS